MNNKILVALMVSAGLLSAAGVMAAETDGPWLVRARAVNLSFSNGQADNLQGNVGAKVEADNLTIPEVDISYFFTKNIAAELVLTYPQSVDIKAGGSKIGSVKVLPPSLLLQYHFTDLGAFKPYVGAGLNYTLFTSRNVTPAISVDNSSFGVAAQVGFDYLIDKHWSFNVDVKYIKMSTDVKLGSTKVGKLDLDPTLFGVGFGYRF